MDNKISWFDRVMTPKTKAYKDFENEIKNTSPEIFFRDGEREFSNQEKKFMQIYKYRESQVIGSSDFTVTTRFDELFLEPDFKENLVSASHLPKGWCWYDYDDGSGSLKSPNGNNYYSYDLQTQEYKLPTLHNRWTNMKDLFEPPKSLNAFKTYAELDLIEKAAENDLSPKLSEAEKNDLLNYISLNKKIANGEILNIYHNSDSLPAKKILPENDIEFNNQNPKIMETKKEFDQVKYLKDQMKYLGFGEDEKLQKDLEKGISSKKQEFEINTNSNKTLPENKVDFTLKFNKTDRGGIFLNSYHAKMTNDKKEEISHNFPVNKDYTFTAKEVVNLLEGRSVKIEFLNPKNNQIEPAFVQFNFNEPKTDKGNYFFQNFYKNYGVDTAKIVEKSNLVFDNPEWKENSIKSLEKGNIVKVKFKEDDQIREGKAVLDPQNKNLKLYDNGMNRLNTNKPLEGLVQDHKHDKANLREQSIKR